MEGGLAALLMIVDFVLPAPSKTTSVNVESRPCRGGAPDAIAANRRRRFSALSLTLCDQLKN